MYKNLSIILDKGIKIINSFLYDKITGLEFIYQFEDWYYYNFDKYKPQNEIEKKTVNIIWEYGPEIIGWYEPCKAIHEADPSYWDENRTKEEILKLKKKLQVCLKNNIFFVKPTKKLLDDKLKKHLENIILSIHKSYRYESHKQLIDIISKVSEQFLPATKLEQEIQSCLKKYLKTLKHFDLISTQIKDPVNEQDPFIDKTNKLKKKLYYYLNPELK